MKNLRPHVRRQILTEHIRHLENAWLCRYGQWNRDALLRELEVALETRRKQLRKARRVAAKG